MKSQPGNQIDKEEFSGIGVRQPVFSGRFYPGETGKLQKALDSFFRDAVVQSGEKPLALLAPHAGYLYSGQIAADAYNQAKNYNYDVIVILGTNHSIPNFHKISIYPRAGYQVPTGLAEIDEELVEKLVSTHDFFTYNPAIHKNEHSVEVQIPFIRHAFPNTKILPLIVGYSDIHRSEMYGKALADLLRGRDALLVASSDLSHYPAFEDANQVDRKTLEALAEFDPLHLDTVISEQMKQPVSNLHTTACGIGPIYTMMVAAGKAGAKYVNLISYANSGHTALGTRDKVVGYGAASFTANPVSKKYAVFEEPETEKASTVLSEENKQVLLGLARRSITQFLETDTVPMPRNFPEDLRVRRGAFVTLRKAGKLRGCVGHVDDDRFLYPVIESMALQAAFGDRRFLPVTHDELSAIEIEVSILTPFHKIEDVHTISLGEDGVLLLKDARRAVFLPEVAVNMGWDVNRLMSELCIKAGLKPDAWKMNAEIFTFQTDKFRE